MDRPAFHLLVVEDDATLRQAIRLQLELSWPGSRVSEAHGLAQARALLDAGPDIVLLDVALPDGRGTQLLPELLGLDPPPAIVAMSGTVTPNEAFELARRGACAFVAKPLHVDELVAVIEALPRDRLPPAGLARELVGVRSIHDVQANVRRAMLERALALTGWNRTAAARLLNLTRQAVQQMIREFELDPPTKAEQT